LIDQSTLARTGSTGKTQNPRMSSLRKQRFQQFRPPRRAVLDHADSPRQSPRVAGAQLFNQGLEVVPQTASVKHPMKKNEIVVR